MGGRRIITHIKEGKAALEAYSTTGKFTEFRGEDLGYVKRNYRIREEVKEPETVTVYSARYVNKEDEELIIYKGERTDKLLLERLLSTEGITQVGEIEEKVYEVKR